MNKPREFWIEFGGDPSDDEEVYKRYSSTKPFKPTSYAEEVIHCIEKSAYDALKTELEQASRLRDTPGGKRIWAAINEIERLQARIKKLEGKKK